MADAIGAFFVGRVRQGAVHPAGLRRALMPSMLPGMKGSPSLLLCGASIVLSSLAVGQSGRAERERVAAIDAAITKSKVQFEAGEAERAARLLRRTARDASKLFDPAARADALARLAESLDEVDPLCARRQKGMAGAAKALLGAVEAYESRKWFRSALALCDDAARWDAAAADAVRRRIESSIVTGAVPPTPVRVDWSGGERVFGGGDWLVEANSVRATELSKNREIFLSATQLPARIAARAELMIGGYKGEAGLVLGYRDVSDFVVLAVHWKKKLEAEWRVERRAGSSYKPIAEGTFAVEKGKDELLVPVTVDSLQGGLAIQVGGQERRVISPPAVGDVLRPGYFGLEAHSARGKRVELGWKNVEVATYGLAPTSGLRSADEAQRIAAAQAEAGDVEAAARTLFGGYALAFRIEDGTERKKQLAAIGAGLKELDPSFDATKRARLAASKKLVPVGMGYMRSKWFDTGLEILRDAADFGGSAAVRKLDESIARAGRSGGDVMKKFMSRREQTSGKAEYRWRFVDDEFHSPKLVGRFSAGTRSARTLGKTARISFEVLADGPKAKGALMFGVRSVAEGTSYYVVELMHWGSYSSLFLYHYMPPEKVLKPIKEDVSYYSKKGRSQWIEVTVDFSPDRIAMRLEDNEWVDCGKPKAPTQGHVGFFVSGDSPFRDPVRFRNLRIATPPK